MCANSCPRVVASMLSWVHFRIYPVEKRIIPGPSMGLAAFAKKELAMKRVMSEFSRPYSHEDHAYVLFYTLELAIPPGIHP